LNRQRSGVALMAKRGESIIFIGDREADHVAIEPLGKVSSGWRSTNISVHCGVWAGHFTGQFFEGELTKFGKEIDYFYQNLKPTAALHSAEHYLQLTLADAGQGRIRVEGRAQERLGAKTMLEFEFEADRAALPEVARLLMDTDRPR